MVGGPNDAGKSTLVRRYGRGRLRIVNPDDVARILAPDDFNSRSVQVQAGRVALAERAELIAARTTFLVETTLSGNSEIALMRDARAAGFKVNFVFVGLDRAEMSAARVSTRVAEGGHDVPDEDIARRFGRSRANLPAAFNVAERVIVLENSGLAPRLLMVAASERPTRRSLELPDWLEAALAASRFGDAT